MKIYRNIYLTKPIYEGKSLGVLPDGRTIMVSGALPGETVTVEVTAEKKRFVLGNLLEVEKSSPESLESPCQYFRRCGGCQWLSIAADTQDRWKFDIAKDIYKRFANISADTCSFVSTDQQLHYRHRVHLRGHLSMKGFVRVGFFAVGSHVQVPVHKCMVADTAINDVIKELSENGMPDDESNPEAKFRLDLQMIPYQRDRQQPSIVALIHQIDGNGKKLGKVKNILDASRNVLWSGFAHQHEANAKPFPFCQDHDDGLVYYTSPGAFQQVHLEQNQKLRKLLCTWVSHLKSTPTKILDLYSGSGNLSLQFARDCSIAAVESSRQSVAIGQQNIAANKLKGITFYPEPVARFLKNHSITGYDLIIADPARSGMKEAISSILGSGCPIIIYVSCNPMTAARDIKALKAGYHVDQVKIFDFFPQTYHIETAFLLRRIDS